MNSARDREAHWKTAWLAAAAVSKPLGAEVRLARPAAKA